jgi:photosystem II stability/assembly factor-like uncharacterized protein
MWYEAIKRLKAPRIQALLLPLALLLSASCRSPHPARAQEPKTPWRKESPSLSGRLLAISGSEYGALLFASGENGALLRSANRGKTWSTLPSETKANLYSLWESNSQELFAAGEGGVLLRSTNHGDTWQHLTSQTQETLHQLYGVPTLETQTSSSRLISAERIFAVGSNGTILFSDNGTSWERAYSGTHWTLYAIWGDELRLYIAGEFGTLLFSEDQGKTWEPIETHTQNTLRSLWRDSTEGVFVAGDRLALQSQQAQPFQQLSASSAATQVLWGSPQDTLFLASPQSLTYRPKDNDAWSTAWSNTSEEIEGIWGRSDDEVYFWTDAGSLYLRTQTGVSLQTLNIFENLYDVYSNQKSTYAIGDNGTILKQQKSGWSRQTIEDNPSQRLYSFWEEPGDLRYIACEYGILSSAFQSESWREEYNSSETLYGIFGAPVLGVFAVGANGTIIRTQDAGATWEELPVENTLRADLFAGTITASEEIYLVGDDAMLLRSQDQGRSFERLTLPRVDNFDTQALFSIASDPDGTLWISGWGKFYYRDAENKIRFRPDAIVWKLPQGEIARAKMTTIETGSMARSVWRAPDGLLYVAAKHSILSTKDGAVWLQELETEGGFTAVGGSASKLFAIGLDGLIWSK